MMATSNEWHWQQMTLVTASMATATWTADSNDRDAGDWQHFQQRLVITIFTATLTTAHGYGQH